MNISQEILSMLHDIAKNENFSDLEIKCNDGNEKGNGFLSDIARVQIVGKRKSENDELINDQMNLVCKISFPDKSQREQFNSDKFFERETYFYNEIAPVFVKFQQDRGLSNDDMFESFPKCYKAVYDQKREIFVIIMDDLKSRGFQMWQKGRGAIIGNTNFDCS